MNFKIFMNGAEYTQKLKKNKAKGKDIFELDECLVQSSCVLAT